MTEPVIKKIAPGTCNFEDFHSLVVDYARDVSLVASCCIIHYVRIMRFFLEAIALLIFLFSLFAIAHEFISSPDHGSFVILPISDPPLKVSVVFWRPISMQRVFLGRTHLSMSVLKNKQTEN